MGLNGNVFDFGPTKAEENYQGHDYDNVVYQHSGDGSMDLINKRIDNVSECICVWIRELESSGFSTFFYDTESLESKDFYTNEDAFRVEDHIVEVQDEDILEIIHEEGQDDNAGLIGDCTVRLKNGYQLSGCWRKKKRVIHGLICGPSLEAKGLKTIWGKFKGGYLNGPGKATLLDGDCTLKGNFKDGKLHGPVIGLTSKGRLAWAGLFKNGVPHGASWRGVEGGGFLYGNVGPKGYFEGHKNAYIYPDMSTALFGDFSQNKMVDAVPVTIKEVYVEKCNAILRLRFTKKPQNPITYQRWFSTQTSVGVPPLLEDPYESKFVIAGKSRIGDNAGDGLFLKKDVKANTTISFYNGIRVKPGEHSPFENSGYQIYVDWNKAGEVTSDFMDIPPEYISLNKYRASLGHKINHSFDPNCRWGTMEHPTFGRVPRVVTLKDMKAGTELTCHYMICMEEASAPDAKMTWYVDLWDKFSRNLLANEAEENGKTCEEDMDESSDNECNNDNSDNNVNNAACDLQ